MAMVIGDFLRTGYGIGLCMRIPFRSDPHNTTIYIVQYLFIVLSVSRESILVKGRIIRGWVLTKYDGVHWTSHALSWPVSLR